MSYIYWLSQIQHSEQHLVGNNLFILSQLLQHECPILPGFVLDHSLSKQFLADLDHEELLVAHLPNSPSFSDSDRFLIQSLIGETPTLDSSFKSGNPPNGLSRKTALNRSLALQLIAQRSREVISQYPLPHLWSTKIFQAAQQLNSDSFILQPLVTIFDRQQESLGLWRSYTCNNNPQALITALKKVWSELFTASSLLYWHKLGLSIKDVDLAILVRPLQPAYASGIIELNSDVARIKASWGLEQSLLQGDVEPDEYYVDRATGYILSRSLGHKNYAYQLKNTDLNRPSNDCLEAYLPDETHTEKYILEQEATAKLLQLTQIILDKQPQIKYLVWTAPEIEYQSLPQFCFTQLSDRLPAASTLLTNRLAQVLPSSSIPSLLNGVAASPGNILAKTVIVEDFDTHPVPIFPGCILVTKSIPPHHIALIKQVGGIITETGGTTSHGAIVARELNIPAIVNAVDATKILQDGIEILLNGDDGKVYPAAAWHLSLHHLPNNHLLSPSFPITTKLMVNLSQPESITKVLDLPIDGVGLLRSELMLGELLTYQFFEQRRVESYRLDFLNTLTSSLRQFVSAFAPRPVFYRSIDWYAQDSNPILGNRGTYSYTLDPALFDLELEALATITAEGYSNLNLILPFVRSIEEFEFCYRRLKNIGLTSRKSFKVWIMAEVPSVILLLPEYVCAGVQGIAIGTNDLTQLLLGVDREQIEFSDRGLNANHPAMHRAISELITTAKANNIECCICGQAPVEYPDLIAQLIDWGIDAISVEPEAVERTYKAIARAEKQMLLQKVRINQPE